MSETKTVGCASLDLYAEQVRDVEEMRNQLLSFNKKDPSAARKAIQNITILRVYHQMSRIIRYTEMLDKLEDRIYQSIDAKLNSSDSFDEDLWFTLIPIQERLQKIMIDSHKLLEPYLNMESLTTFEVPVQEDPSTAFTTMILDQESREKVRTSAQELLAAIEKMDSNPQTEQEIVETLEHVEVIQESPEPTLQAKAAEVLSQLDVPKAGES